MNPHQDAAVLRQAVQIIEVSDAIPDDARKEYVNQLDRWADRIEELGDTPGRAAYAAYMVGGGPWHGLDRDTQARWETAARAAIDHPRAVPGGPHPDPDPDHGHSRTFTRGDTATVSDNPGIDAQHLAGMNVTVLSPGLRDGYYRVQAGVGLPATVHIDHLTPHPPETATM